MLTVGICVIAGKPYQKGHDYLIRTASKECDQVLVFVSILDRARKGEMKIKGLAMQKIWHNFIEKTLPSNVHVTYSANPMTSAYKELETAEKNGELCKFTIFSDEVDLNANFDDAKLQRLFPTLIQNDLLEKRAVSREDTSGISGTMMRAFLAQGDLASFAKGLPASIRNHAKEIADILTENVRNNLIPISTSANHLPKQN